MTDTIEGFVEIANEYCRYVESKNDSSVVEEFRILSSLLARLYLTVTNLPDVEPTGREFSVEVPSPQIQFDGMDEYWEVFDPYEEEKPLVASLTDDVTDIYNDLKKGLLIYKQETEEDIRDAVWHWRYNFQIHWGFHLVDALRAMHWGIQRMIEE